MTLRTVTYDTSKFKIVPIEPVEKQLDAFDDWCQGRGLTMSWTTLSIVLKRLIAAAPEYQDTCTDGGKCGIGGYCENCRQDTKKDE